jgi:release factor glutamine methyltransferase
VRPDPDIRIKVDDGVYAPSGDTFLHLSAVQAHKGERVLEVGTGTGIIALHCAKAGARVVATDVTKAATECARNNARLNHIEMDVVRTELAGALSGEFDAIMFNPPYLSGQDAERLFSDGERTQLVGGRTGAEVSVRFLGELDHLLAEDGRAYLLVSSESQEAILRQAAGLFRHALVREKRRFFETLAVYELRPR